MPKSLSNYLTDLLQHFQYLEKTKPLVFTITNYVTILDVAQAIRDSNALPAMWFDEECAVDLTEIASCLYINMGTFDNKSFLAMLEAGKVAKKKRIPIVVDVVAYGASKKISSYTNSLIDELEPSIIKGNKGEISALCNLKAEVRGVEALSYSDKLLEGMRETASKLKSVLIASGEKDIVTDGKNVFYISNGVKELSLIVGSGCVSSAIVASFCCCSKDLNFSYAYSSALAMSYFGIAGELARKEIINKLKTETELISEACSQVDLVPSYSFKTKLFDMLFLLSKSENLLNNCRVKIEVV
ncbi:MAG: hydroxyethylthiazole kinase [Candidatus Anstonellales archaeon]